MPAVAKHMHRDKCSEEQHPNPVLENPFHGFLLYQNKFATLKVKIALSTRQKRGELRVQIFLMNKEAECK
jgi:hypothetical protein